MRPMHINRFNALLIDAFLSVCILSNSAWRMGGWDLGLEAEC